MNRILTLIMALIVGSLAASAAKSVVDRAVEKIKAAPSVSATFRVNGADGSLTMCGDSFILSVPEMKTAFNGSTQWTLNVPDSELTITEPTPEEAALINPLGFIAGLRSQFKATTLPDGRVRFTPLQSGSDITEIVAQFDRTTAMPVRIMMKSRAGEMLIDGIRVTIGPKKLSKSHFTLKAPKGTEVIDLR